MVVIEAEQTPMAATAGGDMIEIAEEEVPLADGLVSIEEEETPLADSIPMTGDETRSGVPFAAAGVLAIAAASAIRIRDRKRQST